MQHTRVVRETVGHDSALRHGEAAGVDEADRAPEIEGAVALLHQRAGIDEAAGAAALVPGAAIGVAGGIDVQRRAGGIGEGGVTAEIEIAARLVEAAVAGGVGMHHGAAVETERVAAGELQHAAHGQRATAADVAAGPFVATGQFVVTAAGEIAAALAHRDAEIKAVGQHQRAAADHQRTAAREGRRLCRVGRDSGAGRGDDFKAAGAADDMAAGEQVGG